MQKNTMTATDQDIMTQIGTLIHALPAPEKDKLLAFAEGMATMAALQQQTDYAPEASA